MIKGLIVNNKTHPLEQDLLSTGGKYVNFTGQKEIEKSASHRNNTRYVWEPVIPKRIPKKGSRERGNPGKTKMGKT